MSQDQEKISSSPAPIKVPVKYGELSVLGYNGLLPNGDEDKTQSHFALCQRPKANGVKPSTVRNPQADKASISTMNLHSICFKLSQLSMVVMEYTPDSNTDMFQIGRFTQSPIDFVVTETVPDGQSVQDTISRFACRIICQRSPPYAARIYAGGFDYSKNIFLGEKAVKWKTPDGQMDGLTTNGVLVRHPLHGFTQGSMKPGLWREISVCGNVFIPREPSSAQQQGKMNPKRIKKQSPIDFVVTETVPDGQSVQDTISRFACRIICQRSPPYAAHIYAAGFDYSKNIFLGVESESQELVDGSLIDLCGVTLLWRTPKGLALMPTIDHLEVQPQELYARRTCFVYKAQKDGAGILKDPQRDVCELTLDPDTAHRELSLSENNRKVTHVREDQKYPDNPDRFKDYLQVMCRESLTASCYWEVEWSGQVEIAVTYKGINRQGDDSEMGYNDKSWSLSCNGDDPHIVWHNTEFIDLPVSPSSCSGRVAVYVDWPAGTVSFYTVSSDTPTHLHTFQSTFTEPLYAGFKVWGSDSSVSVCQREEVQ